jgi:hypothetical protein
MNEIVQENAIVEGRADKSYWDVPHSTEIEGFATNMSVNAGARVDFKINVNGGAGSDYVVEIFRLGYYGGSGAREVAQPSHPNAWGGLIRTLTQDGSLRPTGEHVPMLEPRSHGRQTPLYTARAV